MKLCLLTVSEKFEWSKVKTNSFDSALSSAEIAVIQQAIVRTSAKIDRLDAIIVDANKNKKKCLDTFYSAFCGNLWRRELEGERDKHGTRTWPWKSRTIYVNARVLIGKYILALHVGDHPRDWIPLDDARHGYSYMEGGVHVRQVCMRNITDSILYVMTYER